MELGSEAQPCPEASGFDRLSSRMGTTQSTNGGNPVKSFLGIVASVVLSASPLLCDVTLMSKIEGMGGLANSQHTTFIKGTLMRTDMQMAAPMGSSSMILDAVHRQMITLHPDKKTAEITDMSKIGAQMATHVDISKIKVSVTPNGQTKTVMGASCAGYALAMSIPMTMGTMTMDMAMEGTFWMAKGVPGAVDYATFWKAAAENGLFFGDARSLQANPAQGKAMVEMYRKMAEIGGIALESQLTMKMSMPNMPQGAAGGMTITTTVLSVKTDPIPDSMFQIPADYKTTTK